MVYSKYLLNYTEQQINLNMHKISNLKTSIRIDVYFNGFVSFLIWDTD